MRAPVVLFSSLLATALASPAASQDVRFNDRVRIDTVGEAPAVRVWLEGGRVYRYGEPVRVWFRTSEDAYAVVARVDGNGHLTLLHPSSRTRSTQVRGGLDLQVRGNRTPRAAFAATDRMGGGFVFAIASYDPIDLSRLTQRDFDRYVTGVYAGRPSRTYVGDPYRIITRFASLVSYDEQSPFDYDVDYYSVDTPVYVSSGGYSNYCSGFGSYRGYDGSYVGLAERWDDELYYGTGGFAGGCAASCLTALPYLSYGSFGWGYGQGICGNPYGRGQVVVHPPVTPGTPRDSARVPPWLADSIGGSRPDTVSAPPIKEDQPRLPRVVDAGTQIVDDATRRPPVVTYDEDGDRVFSIPDRALRSLRRRAADGEKERLEPTPAQPGGRGLVADGQIPWVRPPREVTEHTRNAMTEGMMPRMRRSPRADADEGRGLPLGRSDRNDRERAEPRASEPPRSARPRFEPMLPSVRGDDRRMDSPPPRADGDRRFDAPPPRMDRPEPRAAPAMRNDPPPRVEQRPPPSPPPVREPAVREPTEKKPDQP